MRTLRHAVSGSRTRYQDEAFDLDLTFVTPRLVAMGFPASGVLESKYRNDAREVADFLNRHFPNRYKVINLSERSYDYSLFHNQVIEAGFPDHRAPPLHLLWSVCHTIDSWLAANDGNIVAVHCLAGKGRTGLVAVSYLLFAGFLRDPALTVDAVVGRALAYFLAVRGQGVTYNGQRAYARFFEQVLRHHDGGSPPPPAAPPAGAHSSSSSSSSSSSVHELQTRTFRVSLPAGMQGPLRQAMRLRPRGASLSLPEAPRLHLVAVRIGGAPSFAGTGAGCTPLLQLATATSQAVAGESIFNSAWFGRSRAVPEGGETIIQVERDVKGDVEVKLVHSPEGGEECQMCRLIFHTSFVPMDSPSFGVLRLPLSEVDVHRRDTNTARFPPHFRLELVFRAADDPGEDAAARPCLLTADERARLARLVDPVGPVAAPPRGEDSPRGHRAGSDPALPLLGASSKPQAGAASPARPASISVPPAATAAVVHGVPPRPASQRVPPTAAAGDKQPAYYMVQRGAKRLPVVRAGPKAASSGAAGASPSEGDEGGGDSSESEDEKDVPDVHASLLARAQAAAGNEPPLMGWITTRSGGVVRRWKRRWCVLHHDHMLYFKSSDSVRPKRSLHLQDVTHVDVESYEEGGEPRSCIMLARRDPGRKPTMLRTDDDEELARWVTGLSRRIYEIRARNRHRDSQ